MKKPSLRKFGTVVFLLGGLSVAVTFFSSFQFNPNPSSDSSFIARAQQKSTPGIKVTISVLSASEAHESFGENLPESNIQPVWLSIENETDDQLVFCRSKWTRIIIRLMKFPTDFMVRCPSPPTGPAMHSFLSAR